MWLTYYLFIILSFLVLLPPCLPLYRRILLPTALRLDCFSQWNVSRGGISRGFKCAFVVWLGLSYSHDLLWKKHAPGSWMHLSIRDKYTRPLPNPEPEAELPLPTHRLMKEKKQNACCWKPLRFGDCLLPSIIIAIADSFQLLSISWDEDLKPMRIHP